MRIQSSDGPSGASRDELSPQKKNLKGKWRQANIEVKSTSEAVKREQKELKKAIESLETCLSSDYLTEQERGNLEEAVSQLKRSLTALSVKDSDTSS